MKIKTLITLLALTALTGPAAMAAPDTSTLTLTQYIDPAVAKPTVQINMPAILLQQAVSDIGKETPELVEAFQGIKSIQLMVIEPKDDNREAVMASMAKLRDYLNKEWQSVFSVNDGEEIVGIFIRPDESAQRIGGVSLVVSAPDSVVLANVTGDIRFDKLMALSKLAPEDWQKLLEKVSPEAAAKFAPAPEQPAEGANTPSAN